jgi:hypothetical protein
MTYQGFPNIYVINMPNRIDRRVAMSKMLRDIGLLDHVIWVEPVRVESTDIPEDMKHMTPGYLSLNRTVADKIMSVIEQGPFIVMEDDLMPMMEPSKIKSYLSRLINQAPADWDMIYLEYCMEVCMCTKSTGTPGLYRAHKPYCTGAIIYNGASKNKFIDCMRTEKQLIDFSYVRCIMDGRINAYITFPPVFAQNVLYQGDLNHLAKKNIQYYLNHVIKMYDSNAKEAKPRLPHCVDSWSTLTYVRWVNVVIVFAIIVIFIYILWILIQNGKQKR